MVKRSILILLVFAALSGCANAPKRGKIYSLPVLPPEESAEITVLRNYNLSGSAIRYYPTVNGEKVEGLYTNEHTIFQLTEGTYRLGIELPLIGSNSWRKDGIEQNIQSRKKYFFLLSPKLLGVEIEGIDENEATERLRNSTFVPTGAASGDPDATARILFSPFKFLGLKEDEGNYSWTNRPKFSRAK